MPTYRYTLNKRAFGAWKIALQRKLRRQLVKIREVERRIKPLRLKSVFSKWREFVHSSQLEREVERRTRTTWSKVQSWLSDA